MLKNVWGIVLCAFACSVSAQVVRQVSTNGLTKAVYTVNLAECAQMIKGRSCWAVIAVPELVISNAPSVTFLFPQQETDWAPGGWICDTDESDYFYRLSDQTVYFHWKQLADEYNEERVYYTTIKIIVIQESQSQGDLKVMNTGTGKSLALEWSTNAPNAKIEGYKVYRRSVTEQAQ